MEKTFRDEFLNNSPMAALQCSYKSMGGRCPEQAIAYAISVNTANYKAAVPAYCRDHCGWVIEHAKPGESLAFERLET